MPFGGRAMQWTDDDTDGASRVMQLHGQLRTCSALYWYGSHVGPIVASFFDRYVALSLSSPCGQALAHWQMVRLPSPSCRTLRFEFWSPLRHCTTVASVARCLGGGRGLGWPVGWASGVAKTEAVQTKPTSTPPPQESSGTNTGRVLHRMGMNGCRAGVCHEMSPNPPGVSVAATNRPVHPPPRRGEDEAGQKHKSEVHWP